MWNLKFTCMTKLFHMCEKISHVIKCMEKKFTHMTKIFHMYYKISHACQKVHMHVKCWCGELVFLPTLISHGSFFHTLFTPSSHDFHTHSPSSATMKFSCFSSNEEDFCLPSSFSVIHVSVNIKNNIEKLTTLFSLFSLSKSPGGHAIFSRCIWVARPVDWVILYWCACRADGRSVTLAVYGHVITKFSRMGRFT